eukprot:scaffold28059_cov67-Attheya_sp.AAC.3
MNGANDKSVINLVSLMHVPPGLMLGKNKTEIEELLKSYKCKRKKLKLHSHQYIDNSKYMTVCP